MLFHDELLDTMYSYALEALADTPSDHERDDWEDTAQSAAIDALCDYLTDSDDDHALVMGQTLFPTSFISSPAWARDKIIHEYPHHLADMYDDLFAEAGLL